MQKQLKKESKYNPMHSLKNAGATQRNRGTIKGQINILDNDRKNRYLHKLEEKERTYWENKRNEKLRLQRFR